jgi:hypothetical protein
VFKRAIQRIDKKAGWPREIESTFKLRGGTENSRRGERLKSRIGFTCKDFDCDSVAGGKILLRSAKSALDLPEQSGHNNAKGHQCDYKNRRRAPFEFHVCSTCRKD